MPTRGAPWEMCSTHSSSGADIANCWKSRNLLSRNGNGDQGSGECAVVEELYHVFDVECLTLVLVEGIVQGVLRSLI